MIIDQKKKQKNETKEEEKLDKKKNRCIKKYILCEVTLKKKF